MRDQAIVLKSIYAELLETATEFVGEMTLNSDSLTVLNENLKLEVFIPSDDQSVNPNFVHCHVVTEIKGEPTSRLDACLLGCQKTREESLIDVGKLWCTAVGSAILSLMHGHEVLGAVHFNGTDPWGVSDCHGFAGHSFSRLVPDELDLNPLIQSRPFDNAEALAPPGLIHLAKVTLQSVGDHTWTRHTEVEGRNSKFTDTIKVSAINAPEHALVASFAVFHYRDQTERIEKRRLVDDAIQKFIAVFSECGDTIAAEDILREQGVDSNLISEIRCFLASACTRIVFDGLVPSFPFTYSRIHSDGTVSQNHKLMKQDVFARGIAICQEKIRSGTEIDNIKNLAMTSAELQTINDALNAGSKLEDLVLTEMLIPDTDVSQTTIEKVIHELPRPEKIQTTAAKTGKPWWKFW